jgi:RNA polymerase primary sigma factor
MRSLKITPKITNREEYSTQCYLNELNLIPVLTKDEEVLLFERVKNGDEHAKQMLIKSNLRFVVSVAKQYINANNNNITLNDLIQEGGIGLIKAVEKYDVTKGFKFISFAVWWIRQSIMLYLKDYETSIKIPLNKSIIKNKIINFINEYYSKNGVEPNDYDIMEHIEVYDEDKYKDIKNTILSIKSFSDPVSNNEEGKNEFIDIFINEGEDLLKNYNNSELVKILLKDLPDKDKLLIIKTYGIGCEKPISKYDLYESLGLNERKYQSRYNSIIRKIKNNKNTKNYKYELI